MDHSLNSLNNFDFLARSFARMHAEGRPVDILAVTATWMKNIEPGFAHVMPGIVSLDDDGKRAGVRALI